MIINVRIFLLDADALAVKAVTVELEDHAPVGRLFDMDVLCPDGRKVDRQELGREGRKCLICGGMAQACARSRTHAVPELQEKTRKILEDALLREDCQTAARLASQALLYEVAATPKPGLVDRENSGSHRDMDFFTFQASAAALFPYFSQCVKIGRETDGANVQSPVPASNRSLKWRDVEPMPAVRVMRGKKLARAAPMLAFADIRLCSAALISGRFKRMSLLKPAGAIAP